MSCPIKVNSNTIELTVHTSCYCILNLICVGSSNLSSRRGTRQGMRHVTYKTGQTPLAEATPESSKLSKDVRFNKQ